MYRLIQRFPEKETINKKGKITPIIIDGQTHIILKEYNRNNCHCIDLKGNDQEYRTGDTNTQCCAEFKGLREIKKWRLPESRTQYCPLSGHYITILNNTPSEKRAEKRAAEKRAEKKIFDLLDILN